MAIVLFTNGTHSGKGTTIQTSAMNSRYHRNLWLPLFRGLCCSSGWISVPLLFSFSSSPLSRNSSLLSKPLSTNSRRILEFSVDSAPIELLLSSSLGRRLLLGSLVVSPKIFPLHEPTPILQALSSCLCAGVDSTDSVSEVKKIKEWRLDFYYRRGKGRYR